MTTKEIESRNPEFDRIDPNKLYALRIKDAIKYRERRLNDL